MRLIKTLSAKQLLSFVILGIVALLAPTGAGAQTAEGLSSEATYHYELAEDNAGVDVTIDLAVTNIKPNRSTSRGTTQYYFNGYYVSIPENATDLVITQNGSPIEFERISDGGFDNLDISFQRNIFYRNTADIDISFTLSSGGPRSTQPVRINAAYAGFEAWTTPGVDTSTVTIEVPAGFEADRYISGSAISQNDDGTRTITIDDITSDEYFYDYIALRNDENLTVRSVEVDGIEVEIQHWPNDAAWANFVEDRIIEDLPPLVDAVGLPWPLDQPLVIQESFAPALSGYGGWYDPVEHVIEIGDEFDDQLVLHEITHVWVNADLFASRWITEGLAEELASIVDAADEEPDDPPRTSLVDANAMALIDWTNGFNEPETEEWAYGASWTVTREITEIIGADGLRFIMTAATNNESPYAVEGEVDTLTTLPSWKNYLDWIQELSNDDEIEELFRDWVVPARLHSDLDERADARELYEELTSAGGDWANPVIVREQMTAWDFDDATASIEAATDVLTERDRAMATAAALGVAVPDSAQLTYQDTEGDFTEALALTTELADSADELEAIQTSFDAERSLFATIGLIGVDPSVDMTAAVTSFEEGDFDDMNAAGDSLATTLDDAEAQGQLRAGIAAAAFVVALVGFVLVIRRRRGRAAKVPDDISELMDTDEVTDPVPV